MANYTKCPTCGQYFLGTHQCSTGVPKTGTFAPEPEPLNMWEYFKRIESKLDMVIEMLNNVQEKECANMGLIEDVKTAMDAETALEGKVIAYAQGVATQLQQTQQQLAAALANAGLTPDQQTELNEMLTDANANIAAMTAALPPAAQPTPSDESSGATQS